MSFASSVVKSVQRGTFGSPGAADASPKETDVTITTVDADKCQSSGYTLGSGNSGSAPFEAQGVAWLVNDTTVRLTWMSGTNSYNKYCRWEVIEFY